MISLPFAGERFDKVFSMTALEFIADGKAAVRELFRVTKPRGTIVVTTLNSLSPWAVRRKQKAAKGHRLFQNMIFRSPDELRALGSRRCRGEDGDPFSKERRSEPGIRN